MIYIKSIGIGLIAVMVAGLLVAAVLCIVYKPYGTDAIAFDPRSVAKSLTTWIVMLLSFAIGFSWEFRRAVR